MENILPSKVSNKTATTGAVGGVSGVGLAPLIIWVLGQFGIDMPPEVAAVAGGLIAAAAATVIAWIMPAKSGKHVDTEPWVIEDEASSLEDLDPNEAIEDLYDPSTDVDVDPANRELYEPGEHVEEARRVGGDA